MGGAVQTLTRQQLEDVAGYFAAQKGLAGDTGSSRPTGVQPTGGGGITASLSSIAAAGSVADVRAPSPSPVELAACPAKGSKDRDRDGDGLADAFDAAPKDAGEFARDADGDGWYGICSAEQLQTIQTLASGLDLATRNTRRYELVQDLVLGTIANWTPVGNCGAGNNCMVARDKVGFAGALDGNGHTLRNLTINLPEAGGVGLFGTLAKTGVVRNLTLENASVTGKGGTGALVGANFGYIADCQASVKVVGRLASGGLVGGHAGQVVNCHVRGDVSGQAAIGGLAGDMNGIVRDSSADVRVTAGKGVGGLVGFNSRSRVRNSFATGAVTGKEAVGGLTFAPDRTLWAFSQLTPTVVEIAPTGVQKPVRTFSDRMYSSVTFGQDGSLYFGEHMMGTQTGHPAVTTKFRLLPGRDVIGDGHVFRHHADGKLKQEYATVAHGGMFGFLAVTSTVLADNDTRMIFVSETGQRVLQYDLKNQKQLPDLASFENNPLEGMGWAAVNSSPNGQFAVIGNFFTGDIVKVRLSDATIVARNNVGQKESLSGIAEFPG